MALNGNDNRGSKLAPWAELDSATEAKTLPAANDPISILLDELDFQDAMKRSIILGICTRLINSGVRNMADLILDIRHHGAIVFMNANMEQTTPASTLDEINSMREAISRRRPLAPNFRKSSSTSIVRPSEEQIAEARKIHEEETARSDAEKPADGDTLMERIRSRIADTLVPNPSGGDGTDKGK